MHPLIILQTRVASESGKLRTVTNSTFILVKTQPQTLTVFPFTPALFTLLNSFFYLIGVKSFFLYFIRGKVQNAIKKNQYLYLRKSVRVLF